jgi:hypothetical protein
MAFAVAIMSTGLASAQLPTCGLPLQPKCTQCRDGVDNDFDALTDLADPGCSSAADNYEGDDPAPDVGGTADVDIDPRTTRKPFGFNTGLSSWNWEPPAPHSGITVEQEAELIRNVGGNAQRIGIQWSAVEPAPGQYDESKLAWVDAMEAELRAHGMRAIIIVWESPMWATDLCPISDLCIVQQQRFAPPRDIAAYAKFLAWIAQRYPEAVIETWNEPNIKGFWKGTVWPDASRMAKMQCAAYDAIKAVNPSTTVLAPGLAYVGPGASKEAYLYLDFMRSLYQKMGRICWDALSVHIYQGTSVDGPNSYAAQAFRVIRNLRAQYGDTTPIWITETGATTSGSYGGDHGHTRRTPEQQRDINRAAVNEYLSTPEVGAVILHTLRDRPIWEGQFSDPAKIEYGFGLLYDGNGPTPLPKPGYCHFVEMIGGEYPGC